MAEVAHSSRVYERRSQTAISDVRFMRRATCVLSFLCLFRLRVISDLRLRLVSGESLMNDGTAIVVFVLMLKARLCSFGQTRSFKWGSSCLQTMHV